MHRGVAPYRASEGPTDPRHPQVVQATGAGGDLQGPDQTALTDEVSGHNSVAPGHRLPFLNRPSPPLLVAIFLRCGSREKPVC